MEAGLVCVCGGLVRGRQESSVLELHFRKGLICVNLRELRIERHTDHI